MITTRTITSIILGAGKGTRMENPEVPKVCNTVGGQVVIHRTLAALERCGVHEHVMVVGYRADEVQRVCEQAPSAVSYVYQAEQRGTGHATRLGTDILEAQGYTGDIMILAGDKVLEDGIFRRLFATFDAEDCDLALIVGDVADFPNSGRIVTDEDGAIIGNIEVFDVARMQLLIDLRARLANGPLPAEDALAVVRHYFPAERKAKLALGPILDALLAGETLTQALLDTRFTADDYLLRVNGKGYPPAYLDRVQHVNLCIFLFKGPVLYEALHGMSSNNAQNEEYLTDLIGDLARAGRRVTMVPLRYPEEAMAFNTQEELAEIEAYYHAKAAVPLRATGAWEALLAGDEGTALLTAIYGDLPAVIAQKRALLGEMLAAYRDRYGDDEVCIARAPARVNIMGRHVDHQGGMNNHIVIDRDTYLVVGRARDGVQVANLSAAFPARRFTLEEILQGYHGQPWLDFVNGPEVQARAAALRGDWSQYVAAPLARLQAAFPATPLCGLSILASGNVPIGGGLSSSSSIVVATMEAAVALNALELAPEQFVELCGEGEWFVGTRGGAGDQAAMKFARRGAVVQVGFFPFHTVTTVPFPTGYVFLVCNSLLRAKKTEGARDTFNHRVACYGIARELFKQECPAYADRVHHLRDIDPETLGVDYPDFLRLLTRIPLTMTRAEIAARLDPTFCAQIFGTHDAGVGDYPVRAVLLFGLAEIARSRRTPEVLRAGEVQEFGQWMNRSHDGDRVVRWAGETATPFTVACDDAALLALAERAAAGDPAAALHRQIGAYACSVPDIDRMADIALGVDGVAGAQLAGAGLGGCLMVLVSEDAAPRVIAALTDGYYTPRGEEPEIYTCYPTAGSGVLGQY